MAVLFAGRLRAFGTPAEIARSMWDGMEARLDLGGRAADGVLATITSVPGVRSAAPTGAGVVAMLDDRDTLPRVVAALVAHEVPVYAAVPREPTLEDVYLAVEDQVAHEGRSRHGQHIRTAT